MRQISDDDEAKKEKYFNETIVDLDVLNRTTSKMSARQLTQKSDADDDEADELLNLLQDLGDEREILLDQNNEEDPEPGPSIVRRQDEQDEIDTIGMLTRLMKMKNLKAKRNLKVKVTNSGMEKKLFGKILIWMICADLLPKTFYLLPKSKLILTC
jgi:hypothetical protein